MPPPNADVSIVIPVFNAAAHLEECLASALGQADVAVEVLCVDDGSTDASARLLAEAERGDPRLRVMRHERNLGAAAARNRALAAVRAPFFRMLDADDILPENSTATLLARARATGAQVVRGSLSQFREDGAEPARMEATPDRWITDIASEPGLWKPYWHTSYLIATDLVRSQGISYPDLRRGEDPVFLARVLVAAPSVSLISDVVYLYRRYRKTTGTGARDAASLGDYLTHAEIVKALFLERHRDAWHRGYGPFLRDEIERLLTASRLAAAESAELESRMRLVFDTDGGAEEAAAGPAAPVAPISLPSAHWNRIFARADPWNYAGEYEQRKYRHTAELLPKGRLGKAAEIGCAEGRFTEILAPRVRRLQAFDLSDVALERARERCRGFDHVGFFKRDLADGLPEGDYDLIVASEVLYYLRDRTAIAETALRLAEALKPGGLLLMTHMNMVSDEKGATGFDFHPLGALSIGAIFSSLPELEFLRELRTELYRVQLFRRRRDAGAAAGGAEATEGPREVQVRRHAPFENPGIKWGGCAVTAAEARFLWTTPCVPVLSYHRITRDPAPEFGDFSVAPGMFERQLAWLQRQGYRSMSAADFQKTWFEDGVRALEGKIVVITFDDAFADFYSTAWPLLRRYGFQATLFVPVKFVGEEAMWDGAAGRAPLMSWQQIAEVSAAGVEIGSHGFSHRKLPELADDEALDEITRSREVLEKQLGKPVTGFCYPWNSAGGREQRLVRQAGYSYAVGRMRSDPPVFGNRLYIPRIEVLRSDTMDSFIGKMPEPRRADAGQEAEFRRRLAAGDRSLYMRR